MYPRTPQQMVSDTFKSAEHIVGTSSLRELQLLLINSQDHSNKT